LVLPMRIAIEATPLTLSSGGLLRYTTELSLALARCFPEDEIFLLSDQPFVMPASAPPNLKRGGRPRNAAERRWWLWGLDRELARLGADVVHGPDFAVPYLGQRPSVLSLHDLSPWMDPAWHHAASRVKRRTPALLEWGIATMIVTHTESVRKQAIERFRLHPDRVVAIAPGVAHWFQRAPNPQPLTLNPFFLYVGTLEPRKNVPTLIEAWRTVRRDFAVDLVLAGRRRADFPTLPEASGLRWLGEVPDESLPALYSGALALVYPSLYEGFGLPVLEAMQCGAPVIVSRALAEVAGDAAIYADTPKDLAEAMRRFASRPDRACEQRARSLARAASFSWEQTARRTRDVYMEARRRFAA
jgi:glycosyltransferase involved in cell wall biosynthesis